MSPEKAREYDLRVLANRVGLALGMNFSSGKSPDAADIVREAIERACLDLEVVERLIEAETEDNYGDPLSRVVAGIRERLTLACDCSHTLADLLLRAESEPPNG